MANRSLLFRMLPSPTMTAAEAQLLANDVRALVSDDLAIEAIQINQDQAREGVVSVRGRLLRPSHEVFSRWLSEFNRRGYTPILRPDSNGDDQQVVLHALRTYRDQHALFRHVLWR
jgi:hypothetical protein